MSPVLGFILLFITAIVVVGVVIVKAGKLLAGGGTTPMPTEPRSHLTFAGGEAYKSPEEEDDEPTSQGLGVFTAVCRAVGEVAGITVGDPFEEDWGLTAEAKVGAARFYLCFGLYGTDDADWLLFVTASGPRAVSENDADLVVLVTGIDTAVRGLDGLIKLRWYDGHAWTAGTAGEGRERPTA